MAADHGDTALASNCFLRAGRSAAQRNEPEAREWLQKASALGEQIGDGVLITEADDLLRDLGAAN